MTWILDIGGIHLTSATANTGGDPRSEASTPYAVGPGWTPKVAEPKAAYQGGAQGIGARLAALGYDNVDEQIPFFIECRTNMELAEALQALKRATMRAAYAQPAVWRWRPEGGLFDQYTEVYTATVQEAPGGGQDGVGPAEGWEVASGTIRLMRAPLFGQRDLQTLINAGNLTNTGTGTPDNIIGLEETQALHGDLIYEGQPLNILLTKPTSGDAARVLLGTILSRDYQTHGGSVTTSSSSGSSYTASSAIDVSTLRTRAGLHARVLARFTSLTSPSNAEARATIQTAGGATLWVGPWTPLSASTTGQVVDLGGAGLDALRVPLSGAASIKVVVTLRSVSGSVVATLHSLQTLLAYDWGIAESAGLASGQRLHLMGAQNLAGGGWLPLVPPLGLITDGGDVPIAPALIRGTLPQARSGASLFVCWTAADGAHTATDTTTVTVKHAPLFRSLRGAG
jgi:hypothetical protein